MQRGRIDEVDLVSLDLVDFNDGENPWRNNFLLTGFNEGAGRYREVIRQWKFTELGRVADLGAGYGRWTVFLAEANDWADGYERNAKAVALAQRLAGHLHLPNAHFSVGNIEEIDAESGSYDGIWCYNTMQFVSRDRCLAEIYRLLRPGGIACIAAYNSTGRVLQKFFQGYSKDGFDGYVTRFAARSLRQGPLFGEGGANYGSADHVAQILEAAGLELVEPPAMEVDHIGGAAYQRALAPSPFDDDLRDLGALGARLGSDREFADAFAQYPSLALRLPQNISFLCRKP